MKLKITLSIIIFSLVILFVSPLESISQTDENEQFAVPGNLIPDDNTPGSVASVDVPSKFDGGFYDKIQGLISEVPQDGDYGVHDGTRYYDVLIVVARDDGDDDRDADETARENKDAIVKRLDLLGARNIAAAESLSFVTASIPVADVPGLSLYDEVYAMGDGETPVTLEVDTASETVHATPYEIRTATGTNLDGSGVVVAIIDSGISHNTAFNSRITDRVECSNGTCNPKTAASVIGVNNGTADHVFPSHGTWVAQVLAASGLPTHNGIAPGVELLDASIGRHHVDENKNHTYINLNARNVVHALDWSFRNGADIANMSFGFGLCSASHVSTVNFITNEAVDKGMIAVSSAGNRGTIYGAPNQPVYQSITHPGCGHNEITVGGINDRGETIQRADFSGRGPAPGTVLLKPEIVAPAHNLQTLDNIAESDTFSPRSGTSYAASQVSATAALLLQAEPDLTPVEIKTILLLGADWQGPVPCTSAQYETSNPNDNCSYARQPSDPFVANNVASLGILNNVGFGILNTAESLRYVHSASSSHIMSNHLESNTDKKKYEFVVRDTEKPVKVILSWLVHPHGSIDEQLNRTDTAVPIANLDFTITSPDDTTIIRAASEHQTNEFAVFKPTLTGTYTITVSGSNIDNINKPVQNFALASTNPLSPVPSSLTPPQNSPPVAESRTVIVSPGAEKIIRLVASDPDGDAVSFRISKDPTQGTITTDEFITKTASRAIFTPNSDFAGTDTIEVTPHDGVTSGSPATITLRSESLPPDSGPTTESLDSLNMTDWNHMEVKSGFMHDDYSVSFPGINHAVSKLFVQSVNMEGTDLKIFTTEEDLYEIAVPPSGTRVINIAPPITILNATLSADGVDEDVAYDLNQPSDTITPNNVGNSTAPNLNDVEMGVEYFLVQCPTDPCSPYSTYQSTAFSTFAIPDNTRNQNTTSTITIPTNGELADLSVSVDITHTHINDLKLVLTSPNGTEIILHENSDDSDYSAEYIRQTYTAPLFDVLEKSYIKGDWVLSVGDYEIGDVGTLNEWGINVKYELNDPPRPPSEIPPIFSDNFEDGLDDWTQTGQDDWIISTPKKHFVSPAPGHNSTNPVLHADECVNSCTIALDNPIDMPQEIKTRVEGIRNGTFIPDDPMDLSHPSASLSFWRFVDSALGEDEYLKVELYNGRTWDTIYDWSANSKGNDGTWHEESFDLSEYIGVSDFNLRFVTQQDSFNEDIQIDDVKISFTTCTCG